MSTKSKTISQLLGGFEPEVLSQLPDEKKIELFDWLISKIDVINPDFWEHDATMVFPTFYFQFDSEDVLTDRAEIMLQAYKADKEYPTTCKDQQEWSAKCKVIEDEVAKKYKGDAS